MKKATKRLLTFALSTLFVGAGLGGSIAAYDALNTKVAAAEETTVTEVDISDTGVLHNWGDAENDNCNFLLFKLGEPTDSSMSIKTELNEQFWNDDPGNRAGNNDGQDVMQYIQINGKTTRAIIKDNANAEDKYIGTKSPMNWLSGVMTPVLVKTNNVYGFNVKIMNEYLNDLMASDGEVVLTFKAGLRILGTNNNAYYLSKDVNYLYNGNGAWAKAYVLTCVQEDGATTNINALVNTAIGTLPEIPAKDGSLGLWHIDGKAISAGTVYTYGANKSATIGYYNMMDVSDQVTFHNWPDEHEIKRIPVTISNSEGNNTMIPAEGLRYYWNDHKVCAAENAGIDVMEYIYLNGKSARTIINENIQSGKYKHDNEAAFPFNMGGCYAPITVEISAVLGVYVQVMDEYINDLIAEDGYAVLTYKAGLGYLSSASDATAYYWAKDVNYLYDTNSNSWGRVYTATVVNGETRTTVEYTVNNRAEKLAEIAAMLPENTIDYGYSWAEGLPEELPLSDGSVYTVVEESLVVMVDLAIDQDVEITIPAGKYAKAELNTIGGGYVVVSYWQDLIITINGEEYVYDPVKLMPARAGTNIITIKSVSGEAVTDTITISSYTQDDYQMNVGANEVYVLDAQEGRNATFTAEVDGEYTFSFAEGEENGAISVITEDEYGMSSEMITMPYTLTLTAGETITFTIGTMNWESDTIEINVEAPYVTSDVWPGEETTISIPEGKYFSTNVYSLVGGKFMVSWSGDVTVEINGEAVENGAVVELITSYEGPNTLVIKAANNAAAEVVLNLANYKEPATPIAVGNVNVTVSVENFYCAGVETIFTATEAGEYKLSVAEGEENAAVLIVTDSEFGMMTEDVELPYAFTLEAGESITFIIATTNVMVESDEINLVLEKVEVTPPAGGDEGEGEGTNPPAGDEGENTNPPADDEGENTNPPATEEEKPGILDQVKGMIPGCSGVVGGIAGGAAALGLAVVALLKKKEDNE